MIQGFKEFIMRGNVIDLAVAVVIGAAFTAVVNAIVASIITPLIAIFWKADAEGVPGIQVPDLYGGTVTFPVGDLITAIVSFFAVAIVVYFIFVMPMNRWKERQAAKLGVVENAEEKLPTEQELLMQIRDLLEQQKQTPKI
ncbi:large conductance mechanosensitive channel protein MscL [Microbacterium chocolatum]|uniref:large conductance mechanosensitive channel protein MscL n=1 Tax=Microbacterium aurantiacum TaxID=162393 RepID=UPI00338FF4D5